MADGDLGLELDFVRLDYVDKRRARVSPALPVAYLTQARAPLTARHPPVQSKLVESFRACRALHTRLCFQVSLKAWGAPEGKRFNRGEHDRLRW